MTEANVTVFNLPRHPSRLKKRKRVGRGISAGQGHKCGRGQTGQKSRSGNAARPRFEGGQTPLVRHLPKMDGFSSLKKIKTVVFNLDRFADVPDGTEINLSFLVQSGLLDDLAKTRVKILGEGEIARPLVFKAHAFSDSAKAKIEAAGGSCEVIE
ncbi:MAG: 50S ribosomal protein L15 [bacterium]|jgi:large subunit ribosomal protein L15